jgi:hypothetical protein
MNIWQLARVGDLKKFKSVVKGKSVHELNETDQFGFTCFHWFLPLFVLYPPPLRSSLRSSLLPLNFTHAEPLPMVVHAPIHRAAQKGEDGIVALLTKREADLDVVDGDLQTPLVRTCLSLELISLRSSTTQHTHNTHSRPAHHSLTLCLLSALGH